MSTSELIGNTLAVLDACGGNLSEASRKTGIAKSTIHRWARKFPSTYEPRATREKVLAARQMTATRPNFGGSRWWFLCPRLKTGWRNCGRRVGKLYLPPGADHFACRLCHDLTYVSCQTSDKRVSWFRRNEEAMLMMLDQNRVDNLNFSQLMIVLKAIRC